VRHVIALDVGGTGMKAALVAADGTLLHQERRPTGRERGPDAVVAAILGFAADLRDTGLRAHGEPPAAAGVAVPGTVDEEHGMAVFSANLGWREVPMRALLSDRLGGVPVALGHDLRTGGLAEGRLGAGRGVDRFLFLALGTGIAAAIGIDGRIEAGAHGCAGELGHVVVRPGGRACGCGQTGCLETVASAAAVARAWAAAGGGPDASASDAARAVAAGDPRAGAVWREAVAALADGLLIGQTLLDPRTVVIGGGLAEAGETLFAPLREAVRERLTFQRQPRIVPAALGDAAGCLGAGLLAWDLLSRLPEGADGAAGTDAAGGRTAPRAEHTPAEHTRTQRPRAQHTQGHHTADDVPGTARWHVTEGVNGVRRTVLTGARVVLPTGVAENGQVVVEDGRIAAGGPSGAPGPAIDLAGHWVVPGFVDIHVHGGGGASYSSGDPEECLRAARLHRSHGTTTTLASLVTGDIDDLCRQAAVLSELTEDGELAGVHFEGPFISEARCGAHDPALLRDPDPAVVRKLVDAARGTARMLTLAPELPGGLESVRLLADSGVIAAVGHTDADYDSALRAVDAGATVATHLFNAMPSIHHRHPGPIPALLEDERVTVELVNDGIHVHPSVLGLAFHRAGAGRVALITDAMGAAGMGDGVYPLGPMRVRVEQGVARLVEGGTIAGSTLTLDAALRHAVLVGHLPVEKAVRALSATPARLLGIDDRVGSLEPGKDADLVVLDEGFELVAVMRRGEWIAGAERVTGA
jgi:N-acetylglucosamine-6-phosphate deacetylase